MMKTLFCTVGGSPAPIVTSARHNRPDRVVFVCSGDDPATGRAGSWVQVRGEGKVCSSRHGIKPDLPAIPAQLGLDDGAWEILEVPADRPDVAVSRLLSAVREAAEEGEVIADYTGGTKSMSAALYLCGAMVPGVRLSLVTGPRVDLLRVSGGLEAAGTVRAESVRSALLLEQVRGSWRRHAYSEASRLLQGAEDAADPQIQRIRSLSRIYAAWDAFSFGEARELMTILGKLIPADQRSRFHIIAMLDETQRALAGDGVLKRSGHATLVCEVRWAARRRAVAGQRDAAALLYYRCLEAIGQWSMRWEHGIDCGDVGDPPEAIAQLVGTSHSGKRVMGLEATWRALAALGGPLAALAQATQETRRDFLTRRNRSVYAHDYRPVSEADLTASSSWFEEQVWPAFLEVAFEGREPYGQLPTSW